MRNKEYAFNCETAPCACCKLHGEKHNKNTLKEYIANDYFKNKLVLVCDNHYENYMNYGWKSMTPICKKAKGLKACNCCACHSKSIKAKITCPFWGCEDAKCNWLSDADDIPDDPNEDLDFNH